MTAHTAKACANSVPHEPHSWTDWSETLDGTFGDPPPTDHACPGVAVTKTHEVKCWPEFFSRIIDGSKRFEVRMDDRGYEEGDRIILCEYDITTDTYTGRFTSATIGYVIRDHCAAIPDFGGHVVFSLLRVEPVQYG